MPNDKINFSVIIPVHNGEKNILQSTGSVINQVVHPAEIIIIDDGSTDNTKPIITQLSKNSPIPIRYFFQDNAGAGLARNRGIEEAKFQWIAFLDADDTWHPEKLKKQIRQIQENPEIEFFTGNYTEWFCDENNIKHKKNAIRKVNTQEIVVDKYFNIALKGYFAATPTVIATKALLEKAGGFGPYRRGQDTDLWCRIGMLGVPVLYDNQSLVDVHVDSFRNITKTLNISERIDQINNLYQLSVEKGKDKEFLPVARVLATEAINQLKFQGRNSEVAGFLDQLKLPFTRRFVIEEKLKARSPKIMGKLIPAYHRAKRRLR